MRKLLREPLVHFLAAGLGLFVLYGVVDRGDDGSTDETVVVVDRDALLTFIQYRTKAFDPAVASSRLDALSAQDLDQLVDDYIQEEVLHREALALGLDRDDYIIRRRLVQKVGFIAEGFAEASSAIDQSTLRRYFEANQDDYFVEPYVTFTHVFFGTQDRTRSEALALAEKKLQELNRGAVHFSEAPRHGERFLYHVNYVERTPDYVVSHFGVEMSKAIFDHPADEQVWIGPFESPYGFHLVMLTTNEPGRAPALDEVEDRVVDDARRATIRTRTEEAIDDIVGTYDVRVIYEGDRKANRASSQAAPP